MIDWLLESVGDLETGWLLLLAFVLPFGETVALLDTIVPGEVGMIVLGAATNESGRSIIPLIIFGSAGAFAGDSTSWYIGHRWGGAIMDRWHFVSVRLRPLHARAEAYFMARGGRSILGARFVGPLRAIVPLVAGTAGMPYRRFAPWNLAASIAWVSTIVILGALFGQPVADFVDRYGIVLTAAVATILAAYLVLRLRRRRSDTGPPSATSGPASTETRRPDSREQT